MNSLILDLIHRRVDASKVKLVTNAKGGEYHSPCPVCGGNDRFHVWPNQDGGATAQRAGVPGTFWCRNSNVAGDVIDLLKYMDGLEYAAACKELRIELSDSPRSIRPLRQPKRQDSVWAPQQWKVPSEKWRGQATKLALAAHEQLLATANILSYLAGRGLPHDAVVRYRLGYLEGEDKTGTCLYRARTAFDLPDKKNKDGTKTRTSLWIPRGLTIPLWAGDEAHRVRLRRRKEDLRDGDSKYLLLEGSGQAPMVLPPEGIVPGLAVWVVVEAELDACAVHHACGGKVGVMASLTDRGKPDEAAHQWLSKAKLILVALDFDTPDSKGRCAGYQGWLWWKERYAVAKRWPVPQGKDPGEAFARGVDLSAWIQAALPDGGSLGQSFPGLVALGGGAVAPSVPVPPPVAEPVAKHWPGAGRDTPLDAVVYPDGFRDSLSSLRSYYAGKSDSDDVLVPCPALPQAWHWRYRKCCRSCAGHPQCLAEFLFSPQMLAPEGCSLTA